MTLEAALAENAAQRELIKSQLALIESLGEALYLQGKVAGS